MSEIRSLIANKLATLNPQQKKAVTTTEGRVLVLAGAGSGKTMVLTYRIAYLISKGVPPNSLLGLTFTNKAAQEMRHRMALIIGDGTAQQVTLSTFHSFCMQVLRSDISALGYTRHFSLYDSYDMHRLIMQICRDLLTHESELPSLAPTIAAIAGAKNKGLWPQDLPISAQSSWHDGFVKKVYTSLQASLRAYNAVDFDNLLFLCADLFQNHPDILAKYQTRYQYLLIDEYQDTNPLQYKIAYLLSQKHNNLCVVGDDDQSIYGFRGAEIRNILEFSGATTIKLEQNYRSTNVILKAASSIIRNNTSRHDKHIWSDKEGGRLIEVFHAPTEMEEASAIVERIVRMKEREHMKWKDFALLYRSNHLSRPLEQALLRYTWKDQETWRQGIPYTIFGGEEFFERREVKDVLAYLRVMLNPFDQEALLRIINLPRRGIGADSLEKLTQANRSRGVPLWQVIEEQIGQNSLCLPEKARQGLVSLKNILELGQKEFATHPLHEALQVFLQQANIQRAIEEEVKSDKMRRFKWENVCALVNAAAEYETCCRDNNRLDELSLHGFVTSTPLASGSSFKKQKTLQEDCVHLMTFHSSKGLEFPACFLIGLEDHILPHEKSAAEGGIEEERRLMYVAMTRAKRFLVLSMAKQRKRMGKELPSRPSRFLYEIPKELIQATRWDLIDR